MILSQGKYAVEMIDECGLLGTKPIEFAIWMNHKLVLALENSYHDPTQSWRFVGRLIYFTLTCPILCHSIHILSQFLQEPKENSGR